MAEWSKAIDLSSIIFGCAGSNPAESNLNKILYSNYFLTFESNPAGICKNQYIYLYIYSYRLRGTIG